MVYLPRLSKIDQDGIFFPMKFLKLRQKLNTNLEWGQKALIERLALFFGIKFNLGQFLVWVRAQEFRINDFGAPFFLDTSFFLIFLPVYQKTRRKRF